MVLLVIVDRSINLNGETLFALWTIDPEKARSPNRWCTRTVEVENKRPNRVLASKMQPRLIAPKQRPQQPFGLGHCAPKRPGSVADEVG